MATITGQKGTEDLAAFRVHFDLHRPILELEPESQPLIVFLNNIYNGGRRQATKTTKFRWSEYELDARFDAVNNGAGYTDSATSIVVDTGDIFYPESLVKVPRTGEVMKVTAVVTNTLTVIRSYGAAAAAALVDNDPLFVIANAREEGDTSKAARAREPAEVTNYTQIFRRWVHDTGSKLASAEDTTPHDWRFQQKVQMIEHQKDKELAFLFGTPGDEAGVTHQVRTTGGVTHFATQNIVDAGGALTEVEFESWLRPFLRYGSTSNKVVFTSRLVGSVLNNFSQGKLQTTVGDKVYGVAISRWISAHGEVRFISHPLLEGTEFGGYAIGVDFDKGRVAYRYLGAEDAPGPARDTQMKENVQANDEDGRKDEILAECGLQMALPKVHGILKNVTS